MSRFWECIIAAFIVCLIVIPFILWGSKRHPLNKRLKDLQGMDEDDYHNIPDHRKIS